MSRLCSTQTLPAGVSISGASGEKDNELGATVSAAHRGFQGALLFLPFLTLLTLAYFGNLFHLAVVKALFMNFFILLVAFLR